MMKRKFFPKKAGAFLISLAITVAGIVPFNTVSTDAAGEYNYAKALQYSMFFYDANMCGTGVDENGLLDWRGDCHVYDAELRLDSQNTNMSDGFISSNRSVLDPDGNGKVDVSGGFHDAGDHVKFGMPEGYAASTVGWGYYEFREQFQATGQAAHAETLLRYFNDYFMKCTFRDSSGNVVAFCYQVGDGDIDHGSWDAPENDTMFRKGWFATAQLPSTDVVTAAAASLAVNYLNFKDTDPQYAAKNLDYAKALFRFAEKNNKQVNDDGPKGYYSSSDWKDDYCWAAAWLYLATEDDHYLEEAFKYHVFESPAWWIHCWNDVRTGVGCILAEINDKYDRNSQEFENWYIRVANQKPYGEVNFWKPVEDLLNNWMNNIPKSGAGYVFLDQWGSARYNTAAQLVALVYDKHNGDSPSKYSNWARSQMDYLLGKNPLNRCYVVGYSSNSVKFPHHRAASGLKDANDSSPHKHVLYGALVGGPDLGDQHIDVTKDYIYNEVAIDYNAAFVGACAGLYRFFGDSSMQIDPSMPSPNVPVPTPTPTPSATPTPVKEVMYGDLNGDKRVNSTDLTMLNRYLLKVIHQFNTSEEAADLNRDGRINSTDVTILKRYLLNRIPSIPI